MAASHSQAGAPTSSIMSLLGVVADAKSANTPKSSPKPPTPDEAFKALLDSYPEKKQQELLNKHKTTIYSQYY